MRIFSIEKYLFHDEFPLPMGLTAACGMLNVFIYCIEVYGREGCIIILYYNIIITLPRSH